MRAIHAGVKDGADVIGLDEKLLFDAVVHDVEKKVRRMQLESYQEEPQEDYQLGEPVQDESM
jgi:hypothetical protein